MIKPLIVYFIFLFIMKMSYYKKNKEVLLEKASDKYHKKAVKKEQKSIIKKTKKKLRKKGRL